MSIMPSQNIINNQGGRRVCHDSNEEPVIFECDEEPLMLALEQGYGYYPVTPVELLGKETKYEIGVEVRVCGSQGFAGSLDLFSVDSMGFQKYSLVCSSEALPRYVSIKMLTVNAMAAILRHHSDEFELLKRVTNTNREHPVYKHCLTLRGQFLARSKHDPHICIVTDVLGSNLTQLRLSQRKGVFDLCTTKRIVRQTLFALDHLHRECRIIHCGIL